MRWAATSRHHPSVCNNDQPFVAGLVRRSGSYRQKGQVSRFLIALQSDVDRRQEMLYLLPYWPAPAILFPDCSLSKSAGPDETRFRGQIGADRCGYIKILRSEPRHSHRSCVARGKGGGVILFLDGSNHRLSASARDIEHGDMAFVVSMPDLFLLERTSKEMLVWILVAFGLHDARAAVSSSQTVIEGG